MKTGGAECFLLKKGLLHLATKNITRASYYKRCVIKNVEHVLLCHHEYAIIHARYTEMLLLFKNNLKSKPDYYFAK